jgi:hypothetical protein
LGKSSFCGSKIDNILKNERGNKHQKELYSYIIYHKFSKTPKAFLQHNPNTPNAPGDFFVVFQIRGIYARNGVSYKNDYLFNED